MGIADTVQKRITYRDPIEYVEIGFQVILISIVAIAVIIPMAMLILQSTVPSEITRDFALSFSLANFYEIFGEAVFQDAVRNTLIFSIGSVVISHILGFIFGYILTRMDVPFQGTFHTMMFLPIFLSPLVLALGYSFAFTRGGYYHAFLSLFMDPIPINNIWGMVFVSSIWLTPFAYSFISAGLQNIDPEMEDAGRLTGATEGTVLREITGPLLKPFLLSSLFLTILLTFQEISIPAILGLPDRKYVLATFIIGLEGSTVPPPYGKMAAIGVVMVIISILIVATVHRLIGDVSEYTVITGRGRGRNIYTSPWKKAAAFTVLCLYVFLFIFMPLFQVLTIGLTEPTGVSMFSFGELSIEHFTTMFEQTAPANAIKNTVTIALVTASGSVILTGVMSYITDRTRGVTASALGWITWIPIGTPGVVLGLAYLWTVLIFDVGLYGTIFVLMLAFFIRFSALGMRMNSSLIAQQAVELDEQAKICGASLFSRLRHVIFPNAKNGMLSIWVILFTLFMNELSTSFFLYTSSSRVITVTVFEYWFAAQYALLGSLATTQILITLSVVTIMLVLFDVEIKAV